MADLLDDQESEQLTDWLVKKLEPLCEAEPTVLAKYILALLQHDKALPELKELCIEQLTDFLQADTEDFVDQLFDALNSKVFLRSSGGGDGDVANAGDGRDEVERARNDEAVDVHNGEEEDAKSTAKHASRDASSGDENDRRNKRRIDYDTRRDEDRRDKRPRFDSKRGDSRDRDRRRERDRGRQDRDGPRSRDYRDHRTLDYHRSADRRDNRGRSLRDHRESERFGRGRDSFGDARGNRDRRSSQRPSEIANRDDSDGDRKVTRRASDRRFMEEDPDSADDGDIDSHPNRRPEYSSGPSSRDRRDEGPRDMRAHHGPRGKNFPGPDMHGRGPQDWRGGGMGNGFMHPRSRGGGFLGHGPRGMHPGGFDPLMGPPGPGMPGMRPFGLGVSYNPDMVGGRRRNAGPLMSGGMMGAPGMMFPRPPFEDRWMGPRGPHGRGPMRGRGGDTMVMSDGSMSQRRQQAKECSTVKVIFVPQHQLDVMKLGGYFKRFGSVVNIKLVPAMERAYIQFATPQMADKACASTSWVCGNRKIKVFPAKFDPHDPHEMGSTEEKAAKEEESTQRAAEEQEQPASTQEENKSQPAQSPRKSKAELLLQRQKEIMEQKQQLIKEEIQQQKALLDKMDDNTSVEDKRALMTKIISLHSRLNAAASGKPLPSSKPTTPKPSPATTKPAGDIDKSNDDIAVDFDPDDGAETPRSTPVDDSVMSKLDVLQMQSDELAAELKMGRGRGRGRRPNAGRGYRKPYGRRGWRGRYGRGRRGRRGRGRSRFAPWASIDNRPKSLSWTNLAEGMDVDAIREQFQVYGDIEDVFIDSRAKSGVITFRARRDAEKAIKLSNTYKGEPMQVEWCHSARSKGSDGNPSPKGEARDLLASIAANAPKSPESNEDEDNEDDDRAWNRKTQ